VANLPTIHILFENADWLPPLTEALEADGFPYRLVKLDVGIVKAGEAPAEGIWINRISPSSHTRGHAGAVGLAREVLFWLERHGRRVINGLSAFEFEMSKFRQDLALQQAGIRTPRTVLAVGHDRIIDAARSFDGPFITKHNQGGKGLGIELYNSAEALEADLNTGAFDLGPEQKLILQQYVSSPDGFITRVEIVGGRFLYAMQSSTEQGFELCPSDACQLQAAPDVCPIDGSSKFSASPITADDPLVKAYIGLCEREGIEIAGIEFIRDADGNRYTYDINGTTNYSGVLAEQIGIHGMREFVKYLRSLPEVLEKVA